MLFDSNLVGFSENHLHAPMSLDYRCMVVTTLHTVHKLVVLHRISVDAFDKSSLKMVKTRILWNDCGMESKLSLETYQPVVVLNPLPREGRAFFLLESRLDVSSIEPHNLWKLLDSRRPCLIYLEEGPSVAAT